MRGPLMCQGCYAEEYGAPSTLPANADEVLALVRAVYDAPDGGTGGNLHIVLDDWNLEDSSIRWCLEREGLTDAERACGEALLAMTESERAAVLAVADGYLDAGCAEEGK